MRAIFLLLFVALSAPTTIAVTAELEYRLQSLKIAGESWTLTVPAGLRLELVTDRLQQPRLLTFLPNGDLLTGSRSGKIYRLTPPYTRPEVLVELANYPHSIAYRDDELLIAQTDGLYRVPFKPGQQQIEQDAVKLLAALPAGGGHSSRSVAIGPDQRVYLSLGIQGNCSNQYLDKGYRFKDRRGGVLVLDETGPRPVWHTFASGLRNPVGIDWHPTTGMLYATNNGPDHLGYEQPPESFARLAPDSFHGMPWFQFNGQTIRRDECIGKKPPRPLADVAKPVATFPARNAPMGVTFITDDAMDARFTHNAVVALRGSWGTRPAGKWGGKKSTRRPPGLVMVQFKKGKAVNVVDIVSGFQRPDGQRLARPVGVATGPDGALYFTSDSHTEGLFRLRPRGTSD